MVSTFQQVFRSVGMTSQTDDMNRHMPMLNTLTTNVSTFLFGTAQLRRKKYLMSWYKTMPELTALTNKVAKDIVGDFHFEPVKPGESSRNKILQANRFAQEIRLRKVMFSQCVDMLVTGEAFGWIGKLLVSKDDMKEAIRKSVGKKCWGMEAKEKDYFSKHLMDEFFVENKQEDGFADLNHIDEDLLKPKKYRCIASSSMEVIHTQFDIKGYVQRVGSREVTFTPKETVHYTLMDVDGKPYGFSSVEAILVQLELLRQMWQNQLALHNNGGYPDKAFVFKNIRPSDPSFQRVEQLLAKYKLAENKHGNLVFTGDLDIIDLTQLDTMQFKDLGLYITGVMAMLWQIPKSSIPYVIGGTNTKDDTGGNSEKGYWRNIEFSQSMYSETMNTQLWIPFFGVKIVFDNPSHQDTIRLQQAEQLKLGNIVSTNQILAGFGKELDESKTLRLLDLTEKDIREKEMDFLDPSQSGMANQLSNSDMNDSDDKKNLSNKKRDVQMNSAASMGKPVGKEMKELLGSQ